MDTDQNPLTDRRRRIIRVDGSIEIIERKQPMREIARLIGADTTDTVILRHMGPPTMVMVVDDLGHRRQLPLNQVATQLYHANCWPGTTHEILGDVAIVPDDDYA